jgi:DNA-directed RNA polymerase specialized sigma subunit
MPIGMLEPDYEEPYDRWKKDPSPDNNALFMKKLQPVLDGAVKTHLGQSGPTIMSRARLMALDGLRSYDPAKGKLQSHLYNHLQGLKRFSRQQTTGVHIPERALIDRYGMDSAFQELTAEFGREPSDAEVSDRTGFSRRRLKKLRSYNPAVAEGTMEGLDGGFGGVRLPGERDDMTLEIVYDELDPYHQRVMEMAMGYGGHEALPNHEIARRMGRSPGAISQAKLRIQKMLDEGSDLRGVM